VTHTNSRLGEHDITVVISTYNQLADLRETLDSIQAQKSIFSIKILLVDDSSTDGTSEYLKNYINQSSLEIDIFRNSESNGSSKVAVLSTKAKIKTQYVLYISAGDYLIDEGKLDESIKFLNLYPNFVGVASGYRIHYRSIDRWEDCMPELQRYGTKELILFEGKKNLYTHNSAVVWRTLGAHHGRVYPKRFEKTRIQGDVLLSLCFLKFGDLAILPKYTSVYSIDGLGVWSSKSESQMKRSQAFLYLRMVPLLSWNLKIKALKLFIRKANTYMLGKIVK